MDNDWVWATLYIGAGLLVGLAAAVIARRLLDRPQRSHAIREAARPAATLLFWLFVAAGLVAAVASTSPDTLRPIPSDLLGYLPRLGVAGLILIAGIVIATVVSTAVGRTASRATGQRQPVAERTTHVALILATIVLALSQLGVDTTILNIVVAAIAFGTAATFAGISITGGRDVARNIATGKTLAPHLTIGDTISIGGHTGTLTGVTTTHALIEIDDGRRAIVPFALGATDAVVTAAGEPPTGDAR